MLVKQALYSLACLPSSWTLSLAGLLPKVPEVRYVQGSAGRGGDPTGDQAPVSLASALCPLSKDGSTGRTQGYRATCLQPPLVPRAFQFLWKPLHSSPSPALQLTPREPTTANSPARDDQEA